VGMSGLGALEPGALFPQPLGPPLPGQLAVGLQEVAVRVPEMDDPDAPLGAVLRLAWTRTNLPTNTR
jgi:hypothetical protein